MKSLFLSMILFFFVLAKGQNTETDSLKNLLTITKDSPKRVLLLEGLSYAYLSSYPDTALQYAMQGLQLAQNINDPKGEAYCTNALGNVYFSVGDYPKALELYFRALEMKEHLKKQQQAIAVTYFNIADVYTEQEEYRHALSYLFKAKQVDEKAKDSSGFMFDLYSLSSIYLRMKNTDSALYYVQLAYQLAQRLHDNNMMGAIVNTYGEIYNALKNFPLALKYYQLSIPYALAINDQEVLSSNYYGLAKVCKQKGLLDSSVFYARKALAISQEAPFLKQVLETSTLLAEVFKTKKQFDSAFHYQELSIATKDSLFNIEKVKKVQNLKLLEQQRQQAIETARLKYRNKIKLYIVLVASAVFLFLAFILWRNNIQKQKSLQLLQLQQQETDKQKKKVELAYEELRTTQAQLIQSEKMASLGELTAGIAHEIQNPLNFINNFSDVNKELVAELKREIEQNNFNEVKEIASDIEENEEKINYHGKRADAIVKGMLQHSRRTKGINELTDINALCDEYLRLSYHGMRAKDKGFNADFKTDFDGSIGKINIVPQDIGRVLLNLFNNAFYAVNEKKKTGGVSYHPVVSVNTQKVDDKIFIRVKDNGNGIPQQVGDKIFQPFFTTKPTGEGTGLGLSLSYDIVKAHGGEIKATTKEGEGAEFMIQLPLTSIQS